MKITNKVQQSIYNELRSNGVDVMGVGITKVPLNKNGEEALFVMVRTKNDAKLVPKEWQGFKIVIRVTGTIRPL